MKRKTGNQSRHAECSWRDVWLAASACEQRFKVIVQMITEVYPVSGLGERLIVVVWAYDALWPDEGAILGHLTREHRVAGGRSLPGDALILLLDLWRHLERPAAASGGQAEAPASGDQPTSSKVTR